MSLTELPSPPRSRRVSFMPVSPPLPEGKETSRDSPTSLPKIGRVPGSRFSLLSQPSSYNMASSYNLVLSTALSTKHTDKLSPLVSTILAEDPGKSVEDALAERGEVLGSIQWLSNHVPICVIDQLTSEIQEWKKKKSKFNERDQSASISERVDDQVQDQSNSLQDIDEESSEDVMTPLPSMKDRRGYLKSRKSYSTIMASVQDVEDGERINLAGTPSKDCSQFRESNNSHSSIIAGVRNAVDDDEGRHPRRQHLNRYRSDFQLRPGNESKLNKLHSRTGLVFDKETKDIPTRKQNGVSFSIVEESKESVDVQVEESSKRKTKNENSEEAPSKQFMVKGMKRRTVNFLRRFTKDSGSADKTQSKEQRGIADKTSTFVNETEQFNESNERRRYSLPLPPPPTRNPSSQFWASTNHMQFPKRALTTAKSCRLPKQIHNVLPKDGVASSDVDGAPDPKDDVFETLPVASRHKCAMLFIDISGFTKLSVLLDPESLSRAINSYFQLLVNEVTTCGGDVVKFAGDAVFAEWQVPPTTTASETQSEDHLKILASCVEAAASCAAKIVSRYTGFLIASNGEHLVESRQQNRTVSTLNVHCGLSAGEVIGVHVGDDESRREYLVIGEPIKQSTEAANSAELGEVFACPVALRLLSMSNRFHETLASAPTGEGAVLARTSKSFFAPKRHRRRHSAARYTFTSSISKNIESWSLASLKQYRKLISLYVHPVIVDNDVATLNTPRSKKTVQARHREEAELRSVFVMFIKTEVSVDVNDDNFKDGELFQLLNDVMKLVTRELNRYSGHLRQYIVDDKGLVLIATFGLRGSSCPNMVTERALPATTSIHHALTNELNVSNRIGATTGNVYCGVIGGIKRHEYAVLGPSVNLAARLMTSEQNPGILVDEAVKKMAGSNYGFEALDPVQAKGYRDPVKIFRPRRTLTERRWGSVRSDFVGRNREIRSIVSAAEEVCKVESVRTKFVVVSGESGMGKSATVLQALELIRNDLPPREVVIATHACRNGDRVVPFGIFRALFVDLMLNHVEKADSTTAASDIGDLNEQESSVASSCKDEETELRERLFFICTEINAPLEFVKFASRKLLGRPSEPVKADVNEETDQSSMLSLVSAVAKAFLHLTHSAKLIVIAMDDMHEMDEHSWSVVKELFENGRKILFVGTSGLLAKMKFAVNAQFWTSLTSDHPNERFLSIVLERLCEEDIRQLVEKTCFDEPAEVQRIICQDVLTQSGGMPYFAREILQELKNRYSSDYVSDECFRSAQIELSYDEFIIHRVDSFDRTVRDVLNLGAVLGEKFSLSEVVEILKRDKRSEPVHSDRTRASLDVAVQAGILIEAYDNTSYTSSVDVGSNNLEDRSYMFCHEIWRSALLKMMLDSRKRDMHKIIASTLESKYDGKQDLEAQMRLFTHWKASQDIPKVANLALTIGSTLNDLGWYRKSERLYKDAVELWKNESSQPDREAGFNFQVLDSLEDEELESVVLLHVSLGRNLAHVHKGGDFVSELQNALTIVKKYPEVSWRTGRSVLYRIYGDLFTSMTFGEISHDEYICKIVETFVEESRSSSEIVHYATALAMKAALYARVGSFEEAFTTNRLLFKEYSPKEHSMSMCQHYGSDRAAQSCGASALWCMQLGEAETALKFSRIVLDDMLPVVERRDVHNAFLVLYPILWVMKEKGLAKDARLAFLDYVVEPFNELYGDRAFTFCLPLYEPILMVLDLAGESCGKVEGFDEYLTWALQEENLHFGAVFNVAMGAHGRLASSITGEICLLLAKRLPIGEKRSILVQHGINVVAEAISLSEKCIAVIADNDAKVILHKLDEVQHCLEQ